MNIRTLVPTLAITLVCSLSPAAGLQAQSETQPSSTSTAPSPDDVITQKIKQAISEDKILSANAKGVSVVTIGGSVTLRGKVNTVEEKRNIEDIAKGMIGVNRVISQLEIYPQ